MWQVLFAVVLFTKTEEGRSVLLAGRPSGGRLPKQVLLKRILKWKEEIDWGYKGVRGGQISTSKGMDIWTSVRVLRQVYGGWCWGKTGRDREKRRDEKEVTEWGWVMQGLACKVQCGPRWAPGSNQSRCAFQKDLDGLPGIDTGNRGELQLFWPFIRWQWEKRLLSFQQQVDRNIDYDNTSESTWKKLKFLTDIK